MREMEILTLAQQGLTDKEVAAELGISRETVRTHWGRLRLRFGVRSRAELVALLAQLERDDAMEQALEETDRLQQEILRRGKLEAELRRQTALFRVILANLPLRVITFDTNGVAIVCEGSIPLPSGLDPNAVIGRSIEELYGHDPGFVTELREALRGRSFSSCYTGPEQCFEAFVGPSRDEDGKIIGALVFVYDVTDRRACYVELRRAQEDKLAILAAIPHAVFRFSRDGILKDYMPGDDYEPTYVDPAAVLGRHMSEFAPEDLVCRILPEFEAVLATRRSRRGIYRIEGPDDKTRGYEAIFAPFGEDKVLVIVRNSREDLSAPR